jgi:transposase
LRASNRRGCSPSQTNPPLLEQRRLERENDRLAREIESLRQQLTERDRKLADAEEQIAEAEKEIAEREKQIAESEKQIAESEKQIADLERQLKLRRQNSTTSSKPPSSDGLAGEPRQRGSKRKKGRRKPGGQPGHRGRWREPVPAERVNEVIEIFPPRCRHCKHRFPGRGPKPAVEGEPRRHQVTELPPIEAHITEYQCQRALCPECGKATQAALPKEAAGNFGPQLTALIAYLTVVCRMPRRVVLELIGQVLGIQLSLGSVQNSWEEASEAVAEPCAELERQLPDQPVVNSDETGYRTNGEKRWLWAMVAPGFVFYKIALSRGAEVLVQLLGAAFAGVLCSDRCPSYLKYHKGAAQFCWAHFKRNVLGVLEIAKTTDAERFCRDLLALHARLFRLWHRFRDGPGARHGPIDRQQLILKSIPLEKKFFALADRYADSDDKDVRNLATALLKNFERFFTFLYEEGVEPTNNSVERALRCAVQWRKISFGSRSPEGEVAVARLLTVARTCQMQGQPPLAYLSAAIQAHRSAQPVTQLLKTASTT